MAGLPGAGAPAGAAVAAARALERYDAGEVRQVVFVRAGENITFRVEAAAGRFALRLHRPGYQTRAAIMSELAWMAALREDAQVRTPAALPGRDGELVQRAGPGGPEAVLLTWMDGLSMAALGAAGPWRRLGALIARVHEHSASWTRPAGFERPAWDAAALVGDRPRWGDPLALGAWDATEERLLTAVRGVVRERLEAFGAGPDRYRLIHADMSFDNVLVGDGHEPALIDFDDAGPGWLLYDIAVALFPHAGRPGFAERRDSLLAGYREHAQLAGARELPTFLMARRLVTLGWTFTRAGTAHARTQRNRRLGSLLPALDEYLAWATSSSAPPLRR